MRRAVRRLVEMLYLKLEWGAPPSRMEGGVWSSLDCRWPYHTHELFGGP